MVLPTFIAKLDDKRKHILVAGMLTIGVIVVGAGVGFAVFRAQSPQTAPPSLELMQQPGSFR